MVTNEGARAGIPNLRTISNRGVKQMRGQLIDSAAGGIVRGQLASLESVEKCSHLATVFIDSRHEPTSGSLHSPPTLWEYRRSPPLQSVHLLSPVSKQSPMSEKESLSRSCLEPVTRDEQLPRPVGDSSRQLPHPCLRARHHHLQGSTR